MNEKLICYCFQHTERDIEEDARRHGRSTIMDDILAAKKAGGCHCSEKNPQGR